MKRIVVASLVAALSVIALPAQAGHRPNSYCSESGDVCASTSLLNGERVLRISTAARYFRAYKLCVTAPDDSRTCRDGMMRDGDGDGIWTGRMSWADRFPDEGPGAYTVRWTANGYTSPRLGFHVPR